MGGVWVKGSWKPAGGPVTLSPTDPVSISTSYGDWNNGTRLGQDPSASDINYRLGKLFKWNPKDRKWEGTRESAEKLIGRLRASAENLESWASGKTSVNAQERRQHVTRLRRVIAQLEGSIKR